MDIYDIYQTSKLGKVKLVVQLFDLLSIINQSCSPAPDWLKTPDLANKLSFIEDGQ